VLAIRKFKPNFADPFNSGSAVIHDVSFRYDLNDTISLRAGVNNLADREPFLGNVIRPVGVIGRSFFFGVTGSL
jgi:outer membrane receptor protein involved in Fe transport